MTGAFLFFWPIKFLFILSHSLPHPQTKKKQPQKPETGQNDGI